ncbi:MAG TPA: TerB family tellurite resistance protein [Gemmatimonadales bacterium]|nr:TerB family tellurite resistance protein [Gemmatimonadales bacterium]
MIRQLLEWLAGLPPLPVYLTLGLISALENVVPPVPADTAVALGAFLSHKHVTTPVGVFLVVWTSNVAGAAGVYFVSRRYGRRFFATPTGRRLLSPASLAVIEREYVRFGMVGIFLARLLPGVRAVVAPFTGLAGLSPVRAIAPMAVASALWYGGLTIVGAALGSQWDRVEDLLGTVNRSLGLVTLLLALVIVAAVALRRRRAQRERLLDAATAALDPAHQGDGAEAMRAAAMLVLELAYADPAFSAEDRTAVCRHVRERWGLPEGEVPTFRPVEQGRLTRFRARLTSRFGHEQRQAAIERLWAVVFSEGGLGAQESRVMELAAELLGVSPDSARLPRR